jgi:predicted RNA-binding protein with PUA-like domain
MSLLRQSRLSVCPVSATEWKVVCEMAGVPA